MENAQDLKQTLFNRTCAIEQAFIDLNKAVTILEYWTNAYNYHEKPDPRAAIAYGSGVAKEPHYGQSAQWFYEYETIVRYIDIAHDYVHSAKAELARALEDRSKHIQANIMD